MELVPCPACQRHVTVRETACPFCTCALPVQRPQRAFPGRLTRAAIFSAAAVVGCDSKPSSPAPQPSPAPVHGSAAGSDDLEKLLDADQRTVDRSTTITGAGAGDAAMAVAAADDAGVPDAGPSTSDAGRERQQRMRERFEQHKRKLQEQRKREQEQQVQDLQQDMRVREMAKPYGAPPARRRVV